ncbi:uncharacterized protein LOC141850995 [Brevipalpus obovatus]|uniref:uncharacterized protein LOC141850995 n=1 Tax=Brevipalpus obovatus TaxID=246614 RepID=UPI003D9EB34E
MSDSHFIINRGKAFAERLRQKREEHRKKLDNESRKTEKPSSKAKTDNFFDSSEDEKEEKEEKEGQNPQDPINDDDDPVITLDSEDDEIDVKPTCSTKLIKKCKDEDEIKGIEDEGDDVETLSSDSSDYMPSCMPKKEQQTRANPTRSAGGNFKKGKQIADSHQHTFIGPESGPSVSAEPIGSIQKSKTVSVKFRHGEKVHRIPIPYTDCFWKHLKTIRKTLGHNDKTHKLIIFHEGKCLTFDETPESLKLNVAEMLACYSKPLADNEKQATVNSKDGPEKSDPNSITIKFRNEKDTRSTKPFTCHVPKNGSLKSSMEEYSKNCDIPLTNLIFEFDGERLSGEETPDELDMDDGSLIDVRSKS